VGNRRLTESLKASRERKVWWVWNRRVFGWKFHLLHGFCAWELQVGEHVLQWFYKDSGFRERNGGPFRHWIDTYGRSI
jgi:hypothetical protein